MNKVKYSKKTYILCALGLIVLLALQFVLHRSTPFIKDDLWYATNLVTGEKCSSFADIIQSQIWHYFNWGGRVINHALLQAVILTGEFGADILNIVATVILGAMICLVAGNKNPILFLLSEAMIVSFNASIHFSMYWQSGSVNYLYSTSWILLYVFFIINAMKEDTKKIKGIEIFIIPLGLAAGWSTENMGPACFVLTVFAMIISYVKKKKIPVYLFEGSLTTLLGSILLITAPGNFVRNLYVEKTSFIQMLSNRFDNISLSVCDFLFPVLLFASIAFCIETFAIRSFNIRSAALLGFAAVAEGAMFLSPAYPQRASFGIMCILISYIITVLKKIYECRSDNRVVKTCMAFVTISLFIHALTVIATDIVFIPF